MHQKTIESVKKLKNWCDANYRSKRRGELNVYLNSLDASHQAVSEAFLKMYGSTPHQYCLRKKTREAMNKIRDTDIPIEQISDEFNFCDTRHLSRVMMSIIEMTPWQYRKWSRHFRQK